MWRGRPSPQESLRGYARRVLQLAYSSGAHGVSVARERGSLNAGEI
jgi:hypothetical protein